MNNCCVHIHMFIYAYICYSIYTIYKHIYKYILSTYTHTYMCIYAYKYTLWSHYNNQDNKYIYNIIKCPLHLWNSLLLRLLAPTLVLPRQSLICCHSRIICILQSFMYTALPYFAVYDALPCILCTHVFVWICHNLIIHSPVDGRVGF